ncbi:4'-phosphopantetheinyl transferase superfamily protein [uncultured Sphingomonas sp.]|uniref:4'-phosphopantetheinyl transferase family protein n=1 Tax=uncultured Sphingomonas sp. TaxID=158754 RepID=UPI0025F6DE3B|nr:4'-phosphopantetheinyl transferase superfamily protein [uncultured Sphingomonas sp.]
MLVNIAADAQSALRAMLPSDVLVDGRLLDQAYEGSLLPEEAEASAHFSSARRAEFATGRISLRNLLQHISDSRSPVLIGDRREPLLPPGVRGTVTHCESLVLTAVAPAFLFDGIGIDVELMQRFTPDLQSSLISQEEADFRPLDQTEQEWLSRCFTAKEASFKAIYLLIGQYIDFTDMALSFSGTHFCARIIRKEIAASRVAISGTTMKLGEYMLAAAWIPASG